MKNLVSLRRLEQTTITIALLITSITSYAHAGPDHSHLGMSALQFAISVLSISATFYCLRKARAYQLKVVEERDSTLGI